MSRWDLHGGPDPLAPTHSALLESLINPLQERIEDWKKSANQLDKDHAKGGSGAGPCFPPPTGRKPTSQGSFLIPCTEYKRARHEIKKKSSDTLKLQKKARKGRAQSWPTEAQPQGAPRSVSPAALWGAPGHHPGLRGPVPHTGPSNLLGGAEGAPCTPDPTQDLPS